MFEDTCESPVEKGWFWLSSRYYSPELCRFISPDDIEYLDPESVNGLNLYCYCLSNPISYSDPSGHVAISIGLLLAIGGIVGAAIGAGASVAGQYLANGCSWGQLALDTVLGGVSGMLSMSPLGLGVMVAAKGIADLINKGVTAGAQKALNSPIFDGLQLDDLIGSGLKNNGLNPLYNKILNQGAKYVVNANGLWVKSALYSFTSSGLSSLFSGWY